MQNVTLQREGSVLTVKVDVSKNLGPSMSGKTIMVATTRGFIPVPGRPKTFIGVNVFRTTIKSRAPKVGSVLLGA